MIFSGAMLTTQETFTAIPLTQDGQAGKSLPTGSATTALQ
jgi:hypothetical protein